MGMYATMEGYRHGGEWLDTVVSVIRENYEYLKNELSARLPEAVVCCLEATYLVMVDLRAYCGTDHCQEFVQDKAHLGVDYGEWFSDSCRGFIRMNLATDPEVVKTAVNNLVAAAQNQEE